MFTSGLAIYQITGKCALKKSDNSKLHISKPNFSVQRLQIYEILQDFFSNDQVLIWLIIVIF
jgi:hypothetical protein